MNNCTHRDTTFHDRRRSRLAVIQGWDCELRERYSKLNTLVDLRFEGVVIGTAYVNHSHIVITRYCFVAYRPRDRSEQVLHDLG